MNLLEKVSAAWDELFKTDDVKISWTPKIHYIIHHFVEYFEDELVEKRSLLATTSDQIIEHCQCYINRMNVDQIFLQVKR